MNRIRIIIFSILSILTGVTFLYSAYTKTLPIETFEYTIVEYVKLPWTAATILSRLLVGIEASLGILLIINLFGHKKWVLKSAISILVIFSIYLIYLWITAGDNINCGCFGDTIWMSPSSSLIKNVVLLIVLLALHRYHDGLRFNTYHMTSVWALIVITAIPFFYFPINGNKISIESGSKYKMNFSALYAADKVDKPTIDLSKGKHIVAFLSLSCPHCKLAAQKMHIMKQNTPTLPFFMVLNGKDERKAEFFKNTKAQNIPSTMLRGEAFVNMAGLKEFGFSLPAIYLVNNGLVESRPTYIDLNQAAIEDWLRKN